MSQIRVCTNLIKLNVVILNLTAVTFHKGWDRLKFIAVETTALGFWERNVLRFLSDVGLKLLNSPASSVCIFNVIMHQMFYTGETSALEADQFSTQPLKACIYTF